jgi:hypothetical protein
VRSPAARSPAATPVGAAPSRSQDRERAALTLTGGALEADAGLNAREVVNAPAEDGTALRTLPRASTETGAESSAVATNRESSPPRHAAVSNAPVRASATRTPQRRSASGDGPGATVPRMQIIEEQPPRMEIVE